MPLCPAANAPGSGTSFEGVTAKRRLRRDWVTRLLPRNRKRAVTADAVLAAVCTPAAGTYEAVALAVESLGAQLRATETQRRACRQRLVALVREGARPPRSSSRTQGSMSSRPRRCWARAPRALA